MSSQIIGSRLLGLLRRPNLPALPHLVGLRNRHARAWTLPPIGAEGLREIIAGPARLAGLDVNEVQEAIVAEARDEPGALPLVENALHWLWEARADSRLSGRRFNEQGGLAGILSRGADDLLEALGADRARALELLFRLVRVDPEGRRHTRRRLPLAEAVAATGGGEPGRALVTRLAGERARDGARRQGPLRLITVTEDPVGTGEGGANERSVNLIHETLVRSKGLDAHGQPQPYWPTLWDYIEANMALAARREQLRTDVANWLAHDRAPSYLWSHERVCELATGARKAGSGLVINEEESAFLGPVDPDAMLAELERPETDHKRRALIGERLDVLGDPRPGVGVKSDGTPEIVWCPVPGGEAAIEVERLLRRGTKAKRKAIAAFQIARYPITVAQYRAFLAADDGWADPQWWADDLYRDPDGDTFDVGRHGNHPALYVNWFDAMAYCRWLSARLGLRVRLPDEWEWQQAATGGVASSQFPWGPDWDPEEEPFRANTFESRLGAVTAVGMYPAGASPVAVLDMAGTIYEWCLNKHDSPQVTASRQDDFDDNRVLRGGSWNDYRHNARAVNRFRSSRSSATAMSAFGSCARPPSLNTDH